MTGEVTTLSPPVPEQEITLVLTPAEFAMLESLRYNHLGGNTRLRDGIEKTFDSVYSDLDPYYRTLVEAARDRRGDSYAVEELFLG